MSRSGLTEGCDDGWFQIMWRGAVASSIRGKRGQAMLRDLLAALEAMPSKRLIAHDLIANGQVCAIGSLGVARGVEMEKIDVEDYNTIAKTFGVAAPLVREIEWMNDEGATAWNETPEQRWMRMRNWVASLIEDCPKTVAP